MPSRTDIAWLALMVAMMGLVAAFWRTRQIRNGQADPIISPDSTSIERPASPPSAIRWGLGATRHRRRPRRPPPPIFGGTVSDRGSVA
ncbi:hypothetical protein [Mycobacterium sp.]|uniref:hypothetical protein n=1 Tax=Mycobacterium sp. TaxID=1785 RepID=UPI003D13B8F9